MVATDAGATTWNLGGQNRLEHTTPPNAANGNPNGNGRASGRLWYPGSHGELVVCRDVGRVVCLEGCNRITGRNAVLLNRRRRTDLQQVERDRQESLLQVVGPGRVRRHGAPPAALALLTV